MKVGRVAPRRGIETLGQVVHGGIDRAAVERLGLSPDAVLDFSVSVNPLGPSPRVMDALAALRIEEYPDSEAGELRDRLATLEGVRASQVAVTSGSLEALRLVALTYLAAGDAALVAGPTFGEYEQAARIAGADVLSVTSGEQRRWQIDPDDIARAARERRPRLVYLCNPNNPTGQYLPAEAIERIARSNEGGLLVVDEAYRPFVARPWTSRPLLDLGNVLLVRSLTKDHGLAGLRLGYVVGTVDAVESLRRVRGPWTVNVAAQAAGLAALDDSEHARLGCALAREGRAWLSDRVKELGCRPVPSETGAFIADVGDAAAVRANLLQHGCLVRHCASFGLPHHVRIGARRAVENEQLVTALARVLSGG